jgi:multiple sugar transport system substrate-binding protein
MTQSKISRREFIRLAALASAAAALAGCAPPATQTSAPPAATAVATAVPPTMAPVPTVAPTSPPPAAKEVTLNIMDNWGAEANAKGPPLLSTFKDFQAANPNIKIKEEVFGDKEIPTKVVTMYVAGEEPDIVFQNLHQAALEWLDDGVTVDMTPLSKQWGLYDTIKPDAITEWTDSKGRLRAIPLEGYTWPIWFNTKILDKAGVKIPTTLDELIDSAKKIRAAGFQPFTTGGMEWTGQFVFFLTVASMLTDQEVPDLYGKGGFAKNAHAVEGVKNFVKLRDSGVFSDSVEGLTVAASNESFYSEKAAMMHGGSWFFAECPNAIKDHVSLGGFPLAAGSPHKKPVIYASFEGKGMWITRNGAKKMDAAEKFVKYFYQPSIMKRFVEQAAMTSPLKSTPVDESKLDALFVKSNQFLSDVEVTLIHKVYIPPKVNENLLRVANETFVPGTTVETILANLDEVYKS